MSRTPHPPAVTDRDLPLLLAVYGTLRRGCRNHHVLGGSEHVADGAVAGVLHEIVVPLRLDYSYPLLVVPPEPRADGPRVVVEVYRVTDPQVLARLDVLEAYDPDRPGTSEYVRARVPLLRPHDLDDRDDRDDLDGPHDPDGRDGAWPVGPEVQAYAYAGAVAEQGPVLPGGDWCTHKGDLG